MLTETQKDLLLKAAHAAIEELAQSEDSIAVKYWGFSHHSIPGDEIFEVQLMVTRDESDFIDPMQSEHTLKF